MLKEILVVFCVLNLAVSARAQKPPETLSEFEKAYNERIRKEYLNGVYIPKDLTEAFIQLNKLIDEESKIKFKNVSEAEASRKLHFSLGRWITYNWGFYGGSRLSVFLNKLGLFYPDDMAQFLITAYHRNLNRRKLKVKELVASFQENRQEQYKERLEKGTLIYEETRKRPPVRDSIPNNF